MTVIERGAQYPGETLATLAVTGDDGIPVFVPPRGIPMLADACAQADEGADLIVAEPHTYRAERTGPR